MALTQSSRALMALLTTATLFAPTIAAAERTITYANGLSANHVTNRVAVQPFAKAVEEATGGSVKFQVLTDGTLVSLRDALPSIRDAVADMTMVVDFYNPNELKTNVILTELSLLGEDAVAMTGAVNEMAITACPGCAADADANNMKILGIYASTPYKLLCTKKIIGLDDFKGLRIRATGAWAGLVEAFGATPVNMATSEQYEGLQRGQIDCSLANLSALTNFGIIDVVKYVVDYPLGTFDGSMFLTINTDTWDSLTEAEKTAIRDNIPAAVADQVHASLQEDVAARSAAEAKGIEFVPAGQDLIDAFKAKQENEVARAVELGNSRGVEDPKALIDSFRTIIAKWTGLSATIGDDPAKFAAALRSEVYDKMPD